MHLFQKNCLLRTVVVGSAVLAALLTPPNIFSETFAQSPRLPGELPDSIPGGGVVSPGSAVVVDAVQLKADSLLAQPVDTVPIISAAVNNSITGGPNGGFKEPEVKVFNPDPQRAVWLSALFRSGLYLARKIIEEQGGTIAAKRKAEKGMIFKVTLPLIIGE